MAGPEIKIASAVTGRRTFYGGSDRAAEYARQQKFIQKQQAFIESFHVIGTHPQLMPWMADANSQYDVRADEPMGDGGQRLHEWAFGGDERSSELLAQLWNFEKLGDVTALRSLYQR